MKQQIQNRTLFINDNLNVLRGMNSESVDLIYIDPPFNSNRTYEAPIGSVAEGAKFKDVWYLDDIEQEWIDSIEVQNTALYNLLETIGTMGHSREANGNKGYLQYMSIRLLEMHRILKPTGSIYLHCDTKMSHYLKMVMDCIFLPRRFRNEIVWSYRTGGASKKQFSKKHDVILFYARHRKQYNFNPQTEKAYTKAKGRRAGKVVYGNENGKERSSMFYEDEQGVYTNVVMRDVWDIPYINSQAKERTGYPTQKPLALLERIIQASSNEGDMVLDAFCGCATTLIACEKLNRQWVGIDISHEAYDLVKYRIETDVLKVAVAIRDKKGRIIGTQKADVGDALFEEWNKKIHFETEPPTRNDEGYMNGRTQKYVYIITNPENEKHNFYKVGVATNPQARLNSLQTSHPLRDLEIKYKKSTPLYNEIEKYIHDKFDNIHEWVMVENMQDIIDAIEGYKEV